MPVAMTDGTTLISITPAFPSVLFRIAEDGFSDTETHRIRIDGSGLKWQPGHHRVRAVVTEADETNLITAFLRWEDAQLF